MTRPQASLQHPAAPARAADPSGRPADSALTADDVDGTAPVDRQADPSHWLPGRALLVVGGAAVLALVIAAVVCLLIWTTAPMQPLRIPVVGRG